MCGVEHLPERPSWDCRSCGKPWPCERVREALAAEYSTHPLSLNLYLASQLSRAIDDLAKSPGWDIPPDLYDRFMGWVRSAP